MTGIRGPTALRRGPPRGVWHITESNVSDLIDQVVDGESSLDARWTCLIVTGFATLDKALAGGLHIGDLAIVGGLPGAGKTIATLQWARNMAIAGNDVLYLCYEHDVATLLGRLMAMEVGNLGADLSADDARAISDALAYTMNGAGDADSTVLDHPIARAALAQIESYSDRLVLSQAPNFCDLRQIEEKVTAGEYDVTVIDYLQKVPAPAELIGIERYTHTVEGLKNLAMDSESLSWRCRRLTPAHCQNGVWASTACAVRTCSPTKPTSS